MDISYKNCQLSKKPKFNNIPFPEKMKTVHVTKNIDYLLKKGFLSISIVLTRQEGNAFIVQKKHY